MGSEQHSNDSVPMGARVGRGSFLIVGVGASAGGLKAFQALLEELPENPGFALVLVPHLSPSHHSMLSGILQRSSKMPVKEVAEGVPVEPDHVYVMPPGASLSVSQGRLHTAPGKQFSPTRECID